jgi:hypothetical protein
MKLLNHLMKAFVLIISLQTVEGTCSSEISNCLFEPKFFMNVCDAPWSWYGEHLLVNKKHEIVFRKGITSEIAYTNIDLAGESINLTEISTWLLPQLGKKLLHFHYWVG